MDYLGRKDKEFDLMTLKKMKRETRIDLKYNISTGGCLELNSKNGYYQYVPSSYLMLDKLFSKIKFGMNDQLVDFGCGLGRVLVVAAEHGCNKCIGIEYNDEIFEKLVDNLRGYKLADSIEVFNIPAEEFKPQIHNNKFFFFNPFGIDIYRKVLFNIKQSLKLFDRECYIFFYAPYKEYVEVMEEEKEFDLQEIIYGEEDNEFDIYVYIHNPCD